MTLQIDTVAVSTVAFSHDGRRLAAGGLEKTVRLWDLATQQEALSLRGHDDAVMAVTFSPDGQQLASASLDGAVKVWDASPNTAGPGALSLRGHNGAVFGVEFQPDPGVSPRRLLLASASQDTTVKLWDATTGEEVRTLSGHDGSVTRVAFSRDGRRLVSADSAGTAKVWDAATLQEVRTVPAFAGIVALSPDGRRLALTAEGTSVHIRDVDTGEEALAPFRAHDVPFFSVAFSPDGRRLATASADGTAKVWDASTGQAICTLARHGNLVGWVAFSPDGRRLATASWDKTAKVWDAATGEELSTLGGRAKGDVKIWDATQWPKEPVADEAPGDTAPPDAAPR